MRHSTSLVLAVVVFGSACADQPPTAPRSTSEAPVAAPGSPITPRLDLGGSAHLNITAMVLDFGEVQAGTASTQQVVNVTNLGSTPVQMSGAGGAPSGPFNGSQDCQGTTLAVGASCHMFFTFNPTLSGPDSSVSNGSWNGQNFSIKLRGAGVPPKFLITTTAIGFGPVMVGTVSPQQVVNITNVGKASVVMSGAGGAPPGNFNGVQDCQGQTLAPGATCHMFFTFSPAAAGPDSSVSSGSWNGQNFSIKLRGIGFAPRFRITPSGLSFGEVQVGTVSGTDTVNITNISPNSIVMSGAGGAPPGNFNGVQDCQGQTLAPGATCHMFFTFSPTALGADSSRSIGSWNGQAFNIPLRGTGIAQGTNPTALFLITTTAIDFSDVRVGTVSPQQIVNITNVTGSSIVMSGAGGAPPGNFNGVQDCQGQTLAPGATCHMFFTFIPAATGPDSSVSNGSWNGQNFSIKLRGAGVLPSLRITPAGLTFGDVQTGVVSRTDTVTITNVGTASVVMSGAGGAPPGNFNGVQDCQGTTLAVGASCHMFFTFSPAAAGPDSSISNGSWNGINFSIPMKANGVPPKFLITPAGFDFAQVEVGTTSVQVTANVTNVGLASIQVSAAGGAPPAPFAGVQDCQDVVLAVGATCHLSYTFSPTTPDSAKATSSGTLNGQAYTIPLIGAGWAAVLQETMDLRPSSIHLGGNGNTNAALFSTSTFDATAVAISSVRMRVNGTADVMPALRGGVPITSVRDANDDGLPDLVVTFNTPDLTAAGLTVGATSDSLVLHGTIGPMFWQATDPVLPKFVP